MVSLISGHFSNYLCICCVPYLPPLFMTPKILLIYIYFLLIFFYTLPVLAAAPDKSHVPPFTYPSYFLIIKIRILLHLLTIMKASYSNPLHPLYLYILISRYSCERSFEFCLSSLIHSPVLQYFSLYSLLKYPVLAAAPDKP